MKFRLWSIALAFLASGCGQESPAGNLQPGTLTDAALADGSMDFPDSGSGARDAGVDPDGDVLDGGRDFSDGASPDLAMDGGDAPLPDLVVRWTNIAPAVLEPGYNLLLEVTVHNIGAEPSPPTEFVVEFRSPDQMPRLLSRVGVRSLAAGEEEPIVLSVLLPTDVGVGNHRLRLTIDPGAFIDESSEANNLLEATFDVVGLTAIPGALNFSGVAGCTIPAQNVTLANPRSAPVRLVTATVVGAPELGLEPFGLPVEIPPAGSLNLTLRYRPNAVGNHMARLDLGAEQGSPFILSVPLTGTATLPMPRTESFFATRGEVDVLLVIDDSGSMSEEQATLSAQVAGLLSALASAGTAWQVGVTTTDADAHRGRLLSGQNQAFGQPRVITAQTPNNASLLASLVQQGISGSGNEQGLEASYLALTEPNVSNHNAGFLRPGAGLLVIYVTDEDDSSPHPVAFYESFFRSLKPPGQVRINAIAGIGARGCPTADLGSRYVTLSNSLGGQLTSICDNDWTAAWSNLSGLGGTSVLLGADPVPGSITVRVNGTLLSEGVPGGTSGWFRDGRRIIFGTMSSPPDGAALEVSYLPAC